MRSWFLTAALALLAACSAGGGSSTGSFGTGGSGGSSGGSAAVTVALSSSTVSAAQPATVTATVKDAKGAGVANTVVQFAVNAAVGQLSAPSALTDSTGAASVQLSPAVGATTGADTVTATATVAGSSVTGSVGYQLTSTSQQFTSFAISGTAGTSATQPLQPYGQAVLAVALSGVSSSAPVSLSLTSACVAAGKATISPATTTSTSGSAQFTYKDNGCGASLAEDTVTATITGASTSTSLNVFLSAPAATSITFLDPGTPQTIYLKGSGYTETATVQFKVVDTAGNPLPGQAVQLTLNTFAGGLTLDGKAQAQLPESQTSDANGLVSVIVNSGTVPTSVRVLATLTSNGITAQSNNLAVSTGLPTQTRFSIAQGTINLEGYNRVTANTYTVYAADRSGNPVPDNTPVTFWSEAGQIDASKTTANGQTTANFLSSTRPDDGRVTVLAYALGEESFIDLNGNNVYDTGEPFQDLGDVVKDVQYDNIYDSANDEYVSLSLTGAAAGTSACVDSSATYPQFALTSAVPNRPGTCDGVWSGKTYVRVATETVLSTSNANPYWAGKAGLDSSCKATSIYAQPATLGPAISLYSIANNATYYVGPGSSGSFTILVADANSIRLNPMPAGTTISVAADNSSAISSVSVSGGSPVVNTASATYASVLYTFASGVTSGGLTLKFTSPAGVGTTVHVNLVAQNPPSTCP